MQDMSESKLKRVASATEWPMAILALLVIPVLVMEDRATTPQLRQIAVAANWIIWIAFAVEFPTRWAADRTWAFPRKAWFDLLLIVLTPPFGVPRRYSGDSEPAVVATAATCACVWRGGDGLAAGASTLGEQKFTTS
jgi:hypothetical protein